MINNRTVIAITHGDINGISYEVILKTLSEPRVYEDYTIIIYGSSKVAGFYKKLLDIQSISFNIINVAEEAHPKKINLINCTEEEIRVEPGKVSDESGKAALSALIKARDDVRKGVVDALVTGPINKKNIQAENFHFPGHTEFLEESFGNGTPALMLLVNNVMRVAVVTGHIPVKSIAEKLTSKLIVEKIRILNESLKQDFVIIKPRIAVLGLNPHAGDEGLIGNEEAEIIIPAMKEAEKDGILCFGPYPADGFFGSGNFNKFDGVLAMYHDQGLAPFKTISMENGVNFTAGLSVVRTSPAHGTAYALAGLNEASEDSFRQALYMAYDIIKNRKLNKEISANPLRIEERRNDKGGKIA